jgi:GcrA cell cycle regulator
MRGFWTPENVEILKEQLTLGASVRAIAVMVGSTRNAVIGKAARLALPMHEAARRRPAVPRKRPAKNSKAKPHPGRKRRAKTRSTPQGAPFPPPTPVPPPPPAAAERIRFAGLLRHHCRYPVTADAPFLFCGHPRQDKSAYCSVHHALCRVKPRQEKTDQVEARRARPRPRPRSRFDFTWTRERAA